MFGQWWIWPVKHSEPWAWVSPTSKQRLSLCLSVPSPPHFHVPSSVSLPPQQLSRAFFSSDAPHAFWWVEGSTYQLAVLVKTRSSDQSGKQCRYKQAVGRVGFGKLWWSKAGYFAPSTSHSPCITSFSSLPVVSQLAIILAIENWLHIYISPAPEHLSNNLQVHRICPEFNMTRIMFVW